MNQQSVRCPRFLISCLVGAIFCALSLCSAVTAQEGKTRTYYVAADEVQWDYAPSGRDEAMGMPFDADCERLH